MLVLKLTGLNLLCGPTAPGAVLPRSIRAARHGFTQTHDETDQSDQEEADD
ncbi:MAG TPA: hypothetical protein VKR06_33655 [Ktedonosporobacter sp.]|nr:hypothetical protein [Ktedonosporobacter sp.]